MSTSYDVIYDKFIRRLKNDDKFFDYKDVSDLELQELVNEHLDSLLDRSVDLIYEYGNPDIDFYDCDNNLKMFNQDLTKQEIALLSNLMYLSYVEQERNRMKALELTFKSSELNVFSPANERKSKMELIDSISNEILGSLVNYLSRDRLTWKYKTNSGGSLSGH